MRKHGLTVDNLAGAEVVLADKYDPASVFRFNQNIRVAEQP